MNIRSIKTIFSKAKYHARTLVIILTVIGFGATVFVGMKWADWKKVTE